MLDVMIADKVKGAHHDTDVMRLNRNEFIMAFAFTLDFLEMEFRESTGDHNKRTGLIAAQIGRAMGLCDEDIFDLCAYAMLHDNGITHQCYNLLAEDGSPLDCTASHCIIGERNLAAFPFLQARENVVKYHHEAFDGSGPFGIRGDDIPLFSQIIALAEPLEIAWSSGLGTKDITAAIVAESGRRHSPRLVEAFMAVAQSVSFWLSLEPRFLDSELNRYVPSYSLDIDIQQVLPISKIMSGIIDSKSPFTHSHSKGLAEKAAVMCDYYGFDSSKKIRMLIAADLHDIGKLAIPNRIIDKPGKLTEEEFGLMKAHTFYTRKVIEAVRGFEDIAQWASNHHEKLDGSGYPFGLAAEELCFESRLMGCLDIYQALTEDRPYRKGMTHAQACDILEAMAGQNKISSEITADIKAVWAGGA